MKKAGTAIAGEVRHTDEAVGPSRYTFICWVLNARRSALPEGVVTKVDRCSLRLHAATLLLLPGRGFCSSLAEGIGRRELGIHLRRQCRSCLSCPIADSGVLYPKRRNYFEGRSPSGHIHSNIGDDEYFRD